MAASRNGHWIWISCAIAFGLFEAMFGHGGEPSKSARANPVPATRPALVAAEPALLPTPRFYTVQANDGWQKIARDNHVDEQALLDANGASEQTVIIPGRALRLPDGASPTTATSAKCERHSPSADPAHTSAPGTVATISPVVVPAQQADPTLPVGGGYGEISQTTGLPRTDYVSGYTRKDGTHVSGYYRSHR